MKEWRKFEDADESTNDGRWGTTYGEVRPDVIDSVDVDAGLVVRTKVYIPAQYFQQRRLRQISAYGVRVKDEDNVEVFGKQVKSVMCGGKPVHALDSLHKHESLSQA